MENEQSFTVISHGRGPSQAQRYYSAEFMREGVMMEKAGGLRTRFRDLLHRKLTAYMVRNGLMLPADGLFYLDTREPHLVSDITAVTMTTTAKAMYPAAAFPVLGGQYFNRPGKSIKICAWMKFILPATPGNLSANVHWGNGADANGTLLQVAGTAVAATNATLCAYGEETIRCITTGTAGTLQGTGWAMFDIGLIASANTNMLFPKAGAAASAALDLTAAFIPSWQWLQSGTAGSVQVQELKVIALN